MVAHLFRRLLGMLVTLLAVSFAVYAALTYAPGDAAVALLGEQASAEQVDALRADLGLDRPFLARYLGYLSGALRGDLGKSLLSGERVSAVVGEHLLPTLLLAGVAVALSAVGGLGLGLLAALRPGSRLDLLLGGGVALGLAIPPYWVALLLVSLFSVRLGWLPVSGSGTVGHLVLPSLTLALPGLATVARLVRGSVLDTLGADFVRTALAKGLPFGDVLLRHILPNSLIPALTLLGLNLGHLLGGAFVVETIFAWPGLGRLTVQAIFDRDTPVVMGAVLTIAPLCLAANLAVDLLHAALDPRLRGSAL